MSNQPEPPASPAGPAGPPLRAPRPPAEPPVGNENESTDGPPPSGPARSTNAQAAAGAAASIGAGAAGAGSGGAPGAGSPGMPAMPGGTGKAPGAGTAPTPIPTGPPGGAPTPRPTTGMPRSRDFAQPPTPASQPKAPAGGPAGAQRPNPQPPGNQRQPGQQGQAQDRPKPPPAADRPGGDRRRLDNTRDAFAKDDKSRLQDARDRGESGVGQGTRIGAEKAAATALKATPAAPVADVAAKAGVNLAADFLVKPIVKAAIVMFLFIAILLTSVTITMLKPGDDDRAGYGQAEVLADSEYFNMHALNVYQRAAKKYWDPDRGGAVPWTLLAAIGELASENGKLSPYDDDKCDRNTAQEPIRKKQITVEACEERGSKSTSIDPEIRPGIGGGDKQGVGPFLLLPGVADRHGFNANNFTPDGDGTSPKSPATYLAWQLNELRLKLTKESGYDKPLDHEKAAKLWEAAVSLLPIADPLNTNCAAAVPQTPAAGAVPANAPVFLVGDSVLRGLSLLSKPNIEGALAGHAVTFDAVDGRMPPAGVDALKAGYKSGMVPVIMLGHNNPATWTADLTAMLDVVKDAPRIVLVTVPDHAPHSPAPKTARPPQAAVNAEITAAAAKNPKVVIADWNAQVRANPDHIDNADSLDVHLSKPGGDALAALIARTVTGGAPKAVPGAPAPASVNLADPTSVAGGIQKVWRCALRSNAATITLTGIRRDGDRYTDVASPATATNMVLNEATAVAWGWSGWGARNADPNACTSGSPPADDTPYGVFPLTKETFDKFNDMPGRTRCDPAANIAAAAAAFIDGESKEPGKDGRTDEAGPYAPMVGGWMSMPYALGNPEAFKAFLELGPAGASSEDPTCRQAISTWLSANASKLGTFAPLASNPSAAVDGDAAFAALSPPPRQSCPTPTETSWWALLAKVVGELGGEADPDRGNDAGVPMGPDETTSTTVAAPPDDSSTTTAPSTTTTTMSPDKARSAAMIGLGAWLAQKKAANTSAVEPATPGTDALIGRLSSTGRVMVDLPYPPPLPDDEYSKAVVEVATAFGGLVTAVNGGDKEFKANGDPFEVVKKYLQRSSGTGAGGVGVEGLMAAGMSEMAARAYINAVQRAPLIDPTCTIPVEFLAAFGKVESGHGTHGGASIQPNGDVVPRIIGVPLNGTGGNASIPDTDGGLWDGDTVWDRAVGPTQFIPSTWKGSGHDGNDDGVADPHNYFDSALSSALYLCNGARSAGGIMTEEGQRAGAFSYNHSQVYVSKIMEEMVRIRGILASFGPAPAGGGFGQATAGSYTLPIDRSWFDQNPKWLTKPHHSYPAADLPIPTGNPLIAMTSGTVGWTSSGYGGGCGNGVYWVGDDGNGYKMCHGTQVLVTAGQRVEVGQVIAISGYSGHVIPAGPGGAHLHFEIKSSSGGALCPQVFMQAWYRGEAAIPGPGAGCPPGQSGATS